MEDNQKKKILYNIKKMYDFLVNNIKNIIKT